MALGYWNTGINPTDLAKKSFSSMITRLMPNGQAPLFGITSMLKEETAYQPEHGYFSKSMVFPSVTMAASATNSATSFTVVATVNIIGGMILYNPTTRENILVKQSVADGDTTVAVTRGFGTVAGAAVANAEVLYVVGNAFEEASTRPQSLLIVPTRVINYTQIFRNTWLVSGTSEATSFIAGGSADAESKSDCSMLHAVDIEKALLFGQAFTGTKGGYPIRAMDGLINRVIVAASGNVTTLGSTTNYTQLEAALDPAFNQVTDPKNPNERLLFLGGTARRILHNIFRLNSQYMINDQVTDWGLQFDTFKIPRGRFNMVEHALLNAFGPAAAWAKYGIGIDLSSFGMAYMKGRKTQNRDFSMAGTPVDSGVDAIGGTLTTECTNLVKNPAANVIFTNTTAGAAG